MHRVTITVLEYDKTQEGEKPIFRCGLQNVSVGLKRSAPRQGKDTNLREPQKVFHLGQGSDVINRNRSSESVPQFALRIAANAGAHSSWPISPAGARQLSRSNMMALGVGQSFHQGAQMPFKLPPAGKRCGVYRLPRLRHARSEDRLIVVLSL
jgi:hypothetical protein